MLFASLVSFGRRIRVGIDVDQPDKLETTGIFAVSRNPIYVGFALVLVGQFLVFPNWVPLIYLAAGLLLFHRQVLREESACGNATRRNTRSIADGIETVSVTLIVGGN